MNEAKTMRKDAGRAARRGLGAAIALAAVALAACSSPPQRWGEWRDPGLGPDSGLLRGAPVIATCDAFEFSIRQMCQDALLRELRDRGANPVPPPPEASSFSGPALDAQLAQSAAAVRARTVFLLRLTPMPTSMGGPASGMSVGIGGFSFGGGGGSGVGLGLSAPIGGGWGGVGLSANATVSEVPGPRVLWGSTFATSSSTDMSGQLRELARAVADAAQSAGLF